MILGQAIAGAGPCWQAPGADWVTSPDLGYPKNPTGPVAEGKPEAGGAGADWLVREGPDVTFDQVAGLDEVEEEIRLRMVYPFTHREVAERYGIRGGGGLLLYGAPGLANAADAERFRYLSYGGGVLNAAYPETQRVMRFVDLSRRPPRNAIRPDSIYLGLGPDLGIAGADARLLDRELPRRFDPAR